MALDPLRSNTARTFIPSGTGIVGTKSHSLSSRDVRSNGTVNANASPAASPEDSLRSKQPPIAVTTVFATIVDRSSLRCLVRSSGVTACISPGVEDEPARVSAPAPTYRFVFRRPNRRRRRPNRRRPIHPQPRLWATRRRVSPGPKKNEAAAAAARGPPVSAAARRACPSTPLSVHPTPRATRTVPPPGPVSSHPDRRAAPTRHPRARREPRPRRPRSEGYDGARVGAAGCRRRRRSPRRESGRRRPPCFPPQPPPPSPRRKAPQPPRTYPRRACTGRTRRVDRRRAPARRRWRRTRRRVVGSPRYAPRRG
mmetsp:Transcript_9859/g.44914  ORF Transcript_9859/g.44914 Transcript_9859/m.44914 type:complete len:311 (-) Transcript_9859:1058-1990(-)